MQLAEVFRIGMVVPLTEETNIQLKHGDIGSCVEVKLLALTQEEFYMVWETGLFKEINDLLKKRINEYEDESIDVGSLELSLSILRKYIKKSNVEEMSMLLNRMLDIFTFARSANMPIYLIF